MNTTATRTVWIVSLYVVASTLVAITAPSVEIIMAMFSLGILLIPYMVIKVLKEASHSTKTFSD
ncbi:hypothetical protein [Flavobacterium sp. BFFFF1]|uniref:hypothetical protein n=1 Tax=Flavobacterium sp. BFFFF1 TaxID=2015557 RepID=UPI0025B86F0B|nr:hypothetical protein [Flavobacterium sp. BFFFF1]